MLVNPKLNKMNYLSYCKVENLTFTGKIGHLKLVRPETNLKLKLRVETMTKVSNSTCCLKTD